MSDVLAFLNDLPLVHVGSADFRYEVFQVRVRGGVGLVLGPKWTQRQGPEAETSGPREDQQLTA